FVARMNDVAGQRLAQLVDIHAVTRPFQVIGDTVASVCSASARVAVTSGIVLLAWLVGTGILVLRGFYFPQVPRRGISLPPAVNRAPGAGGHGGHSAARPDAV